MEDRVRRAHRRRWAACALRPSAWRMERHDGWCRLSCRAEGWTLQVETRDGELAPSLEALAGLLLLPCLCSRRRLVVPGSPDPAWRENMGRLAAILHGWWGWEERPRWRFRRGAGAPAAHPGERGTGAFFSGGVDSFHTLLFSPRPIRALIGVAGFDVRLRDTERLAWLESTLREVARQRGIEAIWIRTNVREIPLIEGAGWERVHGAALAAVGHLLRHRLERVLIPSTVPFKRRRAWGSTWEIDPLWSSGSLVFAPDGCEFDRNEKVARLAGNPLVERYLRVCWANEPGAVNCSRCEKCLRTMLQWAVCGHPLPRTFDPGVSLEHRLGQVREVPPNSLPLYRDLLPKLEGRSGLRTAVERLIARSPSA